MAITCCKGCDHRAPGCHDRCPDYNTEKIVDIFMKAETEKKKKIDADVFSQRDKAICKAIRGRR